MRFYPHHIGDYRSATAYLSNEEDICYRRLLEIYYDTERPITPDTRLLSRQTRVSQAVVEDILQEFFTLIDGFWHNGRADGEISRWYSKSASAKANIEKRWEKNKNNTDVLRTNNKRNTESYQHDTTQDPRPKTKEKPKVKSVGASATRLPADWKPSDEEIDYCKTQRPDLILEKVVENFSDYWHAKGGAAARKVDWSATWRSWVRNEKAVTQRVNGSRNQHEHNASFMSAILSPLKKREIDVTPNVCLLGKQ